MPVREVERKEGGHHHETRKPRPVGRRGHRTGERQGARIGENPIDSVLAPELAERKAERVPDNEPTDRIFGLAGGYESADQGGRRLGQQKVQVLESVTVRHGEGDGAAYQDERQPAQRPSDPTGGSSAQLLPCISVLSSRSRSHSET